LRELMNAWHRSKLKDRLVELPGFYLPERYGVTYHPDGRVERIIPSGGAPFPVKRVFLKRIAKPHLPFSSLLTPAAEFSNMSLIELSRGCAMGCRFCWAGHNYLPLRFTSVKGILSQAKSLREHSDRIGLISTSVGTYPDLGELIEGLKKLQFRASVSSLRIDALQEDLVKFLTASHTRSLTLAPESGTDRLRFLINKRVTNEEILRRIKRLFDWGIQSLKLYFLIGLPTERDEDIQAIAELVGEIRRIMLTAGKPKGRVGTINVSVNCFVPKPFTPFQWLPMEGEKSLKSKIDKLRRWLTPLANIRPSFASSRQAQLQAILSRGDRRVADFLLAIDKNRGNWKQALRQGIIDPDFYLTRHRDLEETLPWEVIDNGTEKQRLIAEYKRALPALAL
ncbi:MAG: radical SAM protein, partial [Acidobacteriota bacterium]